MAMPLASRAIINVTTVSCLEMVSFQSLSLRLTYGNTDYRMPFRPNTVIPFTLTSLPFGVNNYTLQVVASVGNTFGSSLVVPAPTTSTLLTVNPSTSTSLAMVPLATSANTCNCSG